MSDRRPLPPRGSGPERRGQSRPSPRPEARPAKPARGAGKPSRDARRPQRPELIAPQPKVDRPPSQVVVGGADGQLPWARVKDPVRNDAVVTRRLVERLDEKQRTQRRRRMARGLTRFVGFAAVLLVITGVFFLPVFSLKAENVEISGLGIVVDPLLVDAVIAPVEGQSLATINVPHLENKLRELPGVRDAVVARVWPAGLRVTITTRLPVAAIPDAAGGFILLDDDAERVSHVEVAPAGLPVVNIPLGEDSDRVLRAVIAVVNELPADLLARVDAVSALTEDSVSFQLADGPRVEWGSADQSRLKAQVLVVMLENAQTSAAAVIDVSAPTLPITRSE